MNENHEKIINKYSYKFLDYSPNLQQGIEHQYLDLVRFILTHGKSKENRTGVLTRTIPHVWLKHNMNQGFPLLTTKKMPIKIISAELEGFIKGISDKTWFQDRKCYIWDDWCNPKIVPYNKDEETKRKMREEHDLGPIYGVQWRRFNKNPEYDQLKDIIEQLKKDPNDRRLICSAWNPLQLDSMALPPCHILWHITKIGEYLHLSWFQRSCDLMLGIPFNIASYSLLLKIICKLTNFQPGIVSGFLSDVHIYKPHFENAKVQIQREPKKLPNLEFISDFDNIDDWDYNNIELKDYNPYNKLDYKIIV